MHSNYLLNKEFALSLDELMILIDLVDLGQSGRPSDPYILDHVWGIHRP